MRLIHFTAMNDFNYDSNRPYQQNHHIKPRGLWLSDEDDYGWSEWCRRKEFYVNRLAMENRFELIPDHNVLIINSVLEIEKFEHKYGPLIIDWNKVSKDFGGVIITPYLGVYRSSTWYNGWDCASGCIWDLKNIKRIISDEKED